MIQIGELDMIVMHEDHYGMAGQEAQYIKKCLITFKLEDCRFSKKQKERFLFLVGPRYNPETGIVKIVVKQFMEWEFNYNRAVEIIEECLLEAYRAPQV